MADTDNQPRRALGLFRIAGIRISLDISWFIIFALVLFALSAGYFPRSYPGYDTQTYWLAGFIATLLFFTSVLIHELSHSLMAIRCGIEIPEITLFIFGGVSKLSQEPKDPKTELKISLVGPLSSFALAGVFGLIAKILVGAPTLLVAVFQYLSWINVALGVFNLIPGFPLDGGRVFRAIWWWRTGSLTRATKVATDIGKTFAVALMILGALQIFTGLLISGLWLVFIGMFLRGMSARGYEELIIRKSLEGVPLGEVMIRDVVSVPPSLPLNQLVHDYFLHYTYRGFPVVSDHAVLGLVSLSAVRGLSPEEQAKTVVADVMMPLREGLVIAADASLAEALARMVQEDADRLLVMQEGRLAGLVTKTSLLRFVQIKQILET
ncbi:MAG: CBS domain-containing protein [Deltaproteobacteria bacterium]|nr:CBS domain-containing protein [Deltaproteobacteria bacterium]